MFSRSPDNQEFMVLEFSINGRTKINIISVLNSIFDNKSNGMWLTNSENSTWIHKWQIMPSLANIPKARVLHNSPPSQYLTRVPKKKSHDSCAAESSVKPKKKTFTQNEVSLIPGLHGWTYSVTGFFFSPAQFNLIQTVKIKNSRGNITQF